MSELELIDSNIFRADGGVTNDAGRTPVSVRCPHCRELGSFGVVLGKAFQYTKHGVIGDRRFNVAYFVSVRICPNLKCNGLIFVIEDQESKIVEMEPPELLDFNPDNLPTRCQISLKEAVACHAAGAYRAAAMMVRRLLEELCEENSATGGTLHERLVALKGKIVLPEPLFDAMTELKALGNDAAHVEAKAYDKIGPEEAEDSIELAKEILKALYQLKGLLERLQARKGVKT